MQTPMTPPPQTATFLGCGVVVSIGDEYEDHIKKSEGDFRCGKFLGTEMDGNGSVGVNNMF